MPPNECAFCGGQLFFMDQLMVLQPLPPTHPCAPLALPCSHVTLKSCDVSGCTVVKWCVESAGTAPLRYSAAESATPAHDAAASAGGASSATAAVGTEARRGGG